MSSASAGKFQDHYEVLGIDYKVSPEAVQTAYARLAEKFHPRTGATPDPEKYDAVTLAFEVLSDPSLRKDFDKLKGIGADDKPRFSPEFFEAYGRDTHLRVALLCVLYDRRRSKPFTPALSMRHLENMFSATSVELNFALWYLKQRDMVVMDDKSSMQITVDGMDYLQNHPPDPSAVMKVIRQETVADAPVPEPAAELLKLESAVDGEAPSPQGTASERTANTAARIGSILANRK
jgi:hypothetical protein